MQVQCSVVIRFVASIALQRFYVYRSMIIQGQQVAIENLEQLLGPRIKKPEALTRPFFILQISRP